jgi:hypothetical protein
MELHQAKLNGKYFCTTYGVGIQSGLKNTSTPAELKPAQEQDWPDRDGKEYFLTDKIQDVNVTLVCWLKASSLTDFFSKKNALETELKLPVLKDLWVAETNQTYKVKYNKISNYNFITAKVTPFARFNIELTIVVGQQADTLIIRDGNG